MIIKKGTTMVAVITGDIINSRKIPTREWLVALKTTLNLYGKNPTEWEIYRGDSFQLVVATEQAIRCVFHLKSTIKQFENIDVRMGIGIGEIAYNSKQITESNGTAFVRSGESFDALKKQNILLKTENNNFNKAINIMLSLSLLTANKWTTTVSKIVKLTIENPKKTQTEMAKTLHKSQSNISEALKRGGFEEIMNMNAYYKTIIKKL